MELIIKIKVWGASDAPRAISKVEFSFDSVWKYWEYRNTAIKKLENILNKLMLKDEGGEK